MKDSEVQAENALTSLTLPENMSALLAEATEKTGKSPEEILCKCLEYGITKILSEAESDLAATSQNIA
jgi:hypothetical protein